MTLEAILLKQVKSAIILESATSSRWYKATGRNYDLGLTQLKSGDVLKLLDKTDMFNANPSISLGLSYN